MMAKDAIKEPFAVINADDFYGKESFQTLADGLNAMQGKQNAYCMVAYRLGNTLSDHGSVSRGVCTKNAQNHLTSVEEHYEVQRTDKGDVIFKNQKNGQFESIDENLPVSMNMWGFTPDYFAHSDADFRKFLAANADNLKAEYGIPTMVNKLIETGAATIEVLETPCKWFGVTYIEDRPVVVQKIADLVNSGVYPTKLF